MPGRWRIKKPWQGDAIKAKMAVAVRVGMNETLAKAVNHAKGSVPVDTSVLQGSLRMEPAGGSPLKGSFGSYDVNYAIYVEMGTSRMGAQPYIRPAVDAEFPQIGKRIKALM
jgi:hypothetical protein